MENPGAVTWTHHHALALLVSTQHPEALRGERNLKELVSNLKTGPGPMSFTQRFLHRASDQTHRWPHTYSNQQN